MKNILVKGVIIAGIAVGIAALGVFTQRMFNSFTGNGNVDPAPVPADDSEDELEVILPNACIFGKI